MDGRVFWKTTKYMAPHGARQYIVRSFHIESDYLNVEKDWENIWDSMYNRILRL